MKIKINLKKTLLSLLLVTAMLFLASCTGNNGNTNDTTDSTPSTSGIANDSNTGIIGNNTQDDSNILPNTPDSGLLGDGSGILDDISGILGNDSAPINDTSLNTHAPTGGDGQ